MNAQEFKTPGFIGSFFLSFEGIEGAGKSTQITKVKEYLESKNFKVLTLREPGGTAFGEKLRKAILESESALHPLAEAHLFASSRAQLLNEVILKELSTPNTVVILDRYIDSSIAYQGVANKVGIKNILNLHSCFPLNILPHLTIYIKISLETSKKRLQMRNTPKDYFEKRNDSFYNDLISGYDESSKIFPNRIQAINGEESFENIQKQIISKIDNLIYSSKEQYQSSQ